MTNQHISETQLSAGRIGAIPPHVPMPVGGYFDFAEIVRTGITVSVPLSKGIIINDHLLFALSTDGTLLFSIYHVITADDYNKPVELYIPGEAFAHAAGRLVHFAYNIQRRDNIIMTSTAVAIPVSLI